MWSRHDFLTFSCLVRPTFMLSPLVWSYSSLARCFAQSSFHPRVGDCKSLQKRCLTQSPLHTADLKVCVWTDDFSLSGTVLIVVGFSSFTRRLKKSHFSSFVFNFQKRYHLSLLGNEPITSSVCPASNLLLSPLFNSFSNVRPWRVVSLPRWLTGPFENHFPVFSVCFR